MLDFFTRHGLGETDASLHCNSCTGQNKNRFVLWYCLAWTVLTGRHRSISLHFLVARHTKFAPDWCLGQSAKAGFPASQSLQLHRSGDCCQQQRGSQLGTAGWTRTGRQVHLGKSLPGMKQFHHLRFHADSPGVCFVNRAADDEEVAFNILTTTAHTVPRDRPVALP